ncbi:hypothetical protein BCR37DRAFT_283982 [Protomyces lactucae-debilis]|uniref:Mediator of RNA polymerase II transcription subunit 19 n=1 Tax=Protomyces lactucae-debilis TaxID=2754530 RepID=A0A1Y2FIV7_PROLT|nr:uncharacterized protein BCR37DRAFT_283982 [Protomyces lactucae-debilis]ORY83869.1 hypothetical protein BCR37DRAFT_283982 [Protomyces lactucae-debilis]
MDEGELYLWKAPESEKESRKPSARLNLTRLYRLDDLAYSVRRQDEEGNKINRLSKTYKNQIAALGVLGGATIPSATSRKYLLDLLLSGAAQRDLEGGYKPFTRLELDRGFTLRPGALQGYSRSTMTTVDSSRKTTVPTAQAKRSPKSLEPATASTAKDGDSSDDGSKFKEHDRERRQRKLLAKQMKKRESDFAGNPDTKRQRVE